MENMAKAEQVREMMINARAFGGGEVMAVGQCPTCRAPGAFSRLYLS
jgi:hypothetical protein